MKSFSNILKLFSLIGLILLSFSFPQKTLSHNCLYCYCAANTMCGAGNCCAINWDTLMLYTCWCYLVPIPFFPYLVPYCAEAWSGSAAVCSDNDGWYCKDSDIREYRDYYCSGTLCGTTGAGVPDWGKCIYTSTNSSSCSSANGWYNVGSTYKCCDGNNLCDCQQQEYRSYFCDNSQGQNQAVCSYTVTTTQIVKSNYCSSCGTDEWTNEYRCSGNQLQRKKIYRGCSNNSCYENYVWETVEICNNGCNFDPPQCNLPPSVADLSVTAGDPCAPSAPSFILSWKFSDQNPGDSQSAYRVQVDNNSDFSLPERDSGKVNLSSNSYAVTNLPYNTTYYWRVMVWDSLDTPSNWTIGPSFNTPLHAFPSIDFEYSPQRPTVGEVVQFTDRSEVYGGSQKSSWTWTFENGDPPTSNSQNPTTTFTSIKGGGNGVSLQVCDNTPPAEGGPYCCSGSKRINVTFPLPRWKEVPPTIWAKKFFASLFQFFDNLF